MVKLITQFVLSLILALCCLQNLKAQCSNVQPIEAVRNGNFEAGYLTGPKATSHTFTAGGTFDFYSDLDYAGPVPSYPGSCIAENTNIGDMYVVAKRETFSCSGNNYVDDPYWGGEYNRVDPFQDHTSGLGGGGYALLVDLYTYTTKNGGTPIAWGQTVNIIPNQTYYFSAYIAKFWAYPPAGVGDMQVRIIPYRPDNSQGTVTVAPLANNLTGVYAWQQLSSAWVPDDPTYNRVKIQIEFLETSGGWAGLDLVIDDISFINSCQNIASTQPTSIPNLGANINLCLESLPKTLNSNVATSASPLRQFSWYSGTGTTQSTLVSASSSQNTYGISAPGTYRVCMYETGKCAMNSTVVVTESVAGSGSDINYCLTDQLVAAVSPTAAEPFMTYVWTKNSSPWSGTVNSKTATVDGAGTYTVTGAHSNGRAACTLSKTFNVTASTASITSSIGPGPYTLCTPMSQTLTSSLTGAGYLYRWQKNGVDLGATSSSYMATSAGTYHVVINFNKAGCANVISNDVVINNTNPIAPVDVSFCPNAVVTLSVTPTLANVYKWYDSDGITPVPGTPSATSSSLTTSVLSASKTYYVEDSRSTAATLFTPNSGTVGGGLGEMRVSFTVTGTVQLNSIQLRSTGAWESYSTALALHTSGGTLLTTSTTVGQAADGSTRTYQTASFGGYSIPAGTYYIRATGSLPGMTTFPVTGGSGVGNLTVTGGQIFGNWSIGSSMNSCSKVPVRAMADCTLPVDFINVTAISTSEGNYIQWIVTREENVSLYEVERSIDGILFEAAGIVNATSGSHVKSYTFLDNNSESKTVYYRIKEVDINGTLSYSTVVAVSNSNVELLVVSKNPFEESTQVYFVSSGEEANNLRVTDSKGSIMTEYSVKGAEAITIGQDWIAGLYVLQAWNDRGLKTYKVIKK